MKPRSAEHCNLDYEMDSHHPSWCLNEAALRRALQHREWAEGVVETAKTVSMKPRSAEHCNARKKATTYHCRQPVVSMKPRSAEHCNAWNTQNGCYCHGLSQ